MAEPLLSPVQQVQQWSPLDDSKNDGGYSVLKASLKRLKKEVQKVGNASILGAGDSARQSWWGRWGFKWWRPTCLAY